MSRLLRLFFCTSFVALALFLTPEVAEARPFWWDDQPYTSHDDYDDDDEYEARRRYRRRQRYYRYRQSSRNKFQLGASAIYSVPLQAVRFNVWGPGIGLRAGYTSAGGIYMGILGDLHLGDSDRNSGGEYSVRGFFMGGQFGYDLRLGRHGALRPSFSAGVHILHSSYENSRYRNSETLDDLFFRPGVDLIWTNDDFYIGPQLYFNFIMADEETVTSFMIAFAVGAAL